jgi:hypothetical protein
MTAAVLKKRSIHDHAAKAAACSENRDCAEGRRGDAQYDLQMKLGREILKERRNLLHKLAKA